MPGTPALRSVDRRSVELRRAVAGLLSFAAAEEQALLAADAFRPGSGWGSPDNWAAVPLVACG